MNTEQRRNHSFSPGGRLHHGIMDRDQRTTKRDKISWGTKNRAISTWESFKEGAEIETGTPKIICTICNKILGHPDLANGTSGMITHLTSAGCRAVAKERGLRQVDIRESAKKQVINNSSSLFK